MRRQACFAGLFAASFLGGVGCGARSSGTTAPPAAAGDESPGSTSQTLLGWGLEGWDPAVPGAQTKIFLAVTDQNGQTQSHPLENVAAACTPMAGNGRDVVIALSCLADGSGAELRAVYRGTGVIVLRRRVRPDDNPADAELSFEEIARIAVPSGSDVKPAL
jgi:hypothetical protein